MHKYKNFFEMFKRRGEDWQESEPKRLLNACSQGRTGEVKSLLYNDIYVNYQNRKGSTPLHAACASKNYEIVEALLKDHRVDVNLPNGYNETPFYVACQKGSVKTVKLLLNDGRIDINEGDEDGWTPLLISCRNGNVKIVEMLIKDERIDCNQAETKQGRTPFYIACENGSLEIVKLLLSDERVNINQANKGNVKPLIIACYNEHLDVVKYILASGRRVHLNSTLRIAREHQKTKSVQLLESFIGNQIQMRSKLRKEFSLPSNVYVNFFSIFLILIFLLNRWGLC